jgi:putative ABC transport system permease protein
VFNSSLLAVQERVRVIGILKSVGMTPAQTVAMINTTAGVLGFVASILGVPVGLLFTGAVLSNLSRAYGFGQVRISLSPIYILLLPPLMVGVSILGSWLPGRRAARLDIVTVLRSE